ncbi:rhodanese-like domain-containing protein [Marinobacter sp.]|uniref:rhodanese-like domain-containing protein n=1 Tax=Marinobacter sp. TaxID=50741 RepID=UPI003568D9E0
MIKLQQSVVLCILLLISGFLQAEEGFPGRKLYPTVGTIELDELRQQLDELTVVDVRSRFEYDTLHIAGAHHVALSDRDFATRVASLEAESGKPLVFYCNGRTCEKSYRAVAKTEHESTSAPRSFDAGIFDWARANPDRTVLLGQPLDDAGKLLTREKFEAHLLPPDQFGRELQAAGFAVDARDSKERAGLALFMGWEKRIPFDNREKWDRLLSERTDNNKPLLIYDAVGKQVQWLQYFLEARGVQNYYFMAGGAKAFFDTL